MSWPKLNFRPGKKGFEKIFGELEAQVMEVVWDRGDVSVRDVFEELNADRPLAYTTILSTMRNLEQKGFLQRSQQGTSHIYSPKYSKAELGRLAVNEVVNGLMDGFGQPFLACLVDLGKEEELKETVEHLERLLAEREDGEPQK
jgi:predicted transcriptional regulator